jgi:predicted MFS family arabinose efflux permease
MALGLISIVGVLGGIIGSVLAVYTLSLPILFGSIVCFAAAVFVMFTFRENYGNNEARYSEIVKRTLSYFKGSPALKLLTAADLFRFACFVVYIFLYQPFLVAAGLPASALGVVFAALMVASALGSVLATRLMIRTRKSYIVMGSVLCLMVPLAALPFMSDLWVAGTLFLVCAFAHGLATPAAMIWRNSLIPSDMRASGLSVMSTFANGTNVALSLAMGLIISSWGIEAAFYFGVLAGAISLPLLFLADRESRKVPDEMKTPLAA